MRIACVLLPDLPLAAALRIEPELFGKRVAITADSGTTKRRIARTPRRIAQGLIVAGALRGLTVTEARTIAPDLICRELSLEALRSAEEALCDVALSISPRIEHAEGTGAAFIDLDGTGALFPSARGLLTALETRLERAGFAGARIGIGPTRTVAELAARHAGGGAIVSAEQMTEFLDPLPLDLLDPPDPIAERLQRWGIVTLGQLARLPRPALGSRLGEEGVRLARRAHGGDLRPFRPIAPHPRFEESAEPGFEIDNLEVLAFVLRGALERLATRLSLRGLAVHELELELEHESGARGARHVPLAAPTREPPILLALVRLALEREPPPEPVSRLRIVAAPGTVESAQLDLFLPPLPSPAELAVTVARLEALCGSGRVGAPGLEDTHRPDAARLNPFELASRPPQAREARAQRAILALRALRPAQRVEVRSAPDHAPHTVRLAAAPPAALEVLAHAGPWRLYGEWWGDHPFARDYYDVELSDGRVCRLYHDLEGDGWFLDGVYD
jgi:protein ImuB